MPWVILPLSGHPHRPKKLPYAKPANSVPIRGQIPQLTARADADQAPTVFIKDEPHTTNVSFLTYASHSSMKSLACAGHCARRGCQRLNEGQRLHVRLQRTRGGIQGTAQSE